VPGRVLQAFIVVDDAAGGGPAVGRVAVADENDALAELDDDVHRCAGAVGWHWEGRNKKGDGTLPSPSLLRNVFSGYL